VIVLCYNEKASVVQVVRKARSLLRRGAGKSQVIVVDDGSTDGSAQTLQALARRHREVVPVYHPVNRGIGAALRSGYAKARFENVCAVPGDGQFDVAELGPFLRVEKGTFVSFYRRKQEGYNLFRRALSRFNKHLNRLLLGVDMKDVNWVKVCKREELGKLDLRLESSLLESEICAKLILRGNRPIQTPSVYHPRKGGKAKGASFVTVFRALRELYGLIRIVAAYKKSLKRTR
jgi:dolichol-phosphate mannosyltransferase